MSITVLPVTPGFVAEVGDVDLSAPLAAEDFAAVQQAFWTHAVLIFPEQRLSPEQHIAFAQRFGPLEPGSAADRADAPTRIARELTDVSNLATGDDIWGEESRRRQFYLGNRLWHTDASFRHRPALCSLLYARSIAPIGGHTEFADQRAAYDALRDALKTELAGLVAEHAIMHSRARLGFTDFNEEDLRRMPPVPQMLVRTIPETGRKTLYVASHAGRVLDMPEADGRALIDRLIAHTSQRQFVYTHRWRRHDLVMWDNRCTMHRGTDFDDLRWQRDLQRATVLDRANTCEQEGVHAA